ncbi:amino acid ABC transporter substrate-binding protein [bacterium 1xD42-67]|nr:amino acid ABC transporter substrate-binding protein [bacterium 1xD42-67]
MKKKLSLILAAAICLSLAACGGKGEDTSKSQNGGASSSQQTAGSDLAYVKDKGTLIVGITEFEPMDYKDADGQWIGFDADMARAFAESLGVEPEFQLIDWDSKVMELEGKTLDVVWNGMTLTDDVQAAMECSVPYFNNAQVVIVKKDVADQYQTAESIADLQFAVENGSAGQEVLDGMGIAYTAAQDQATALLEVQSGTADAAVIDYLMAAAMTGEGTSYADLTYTVSLNDEQYGVGFRKGSDLAAALNEFFKTSYADGTMQRIADTYKIGDKLIEQK